MNTFIYPQVIDSLMSPKFSLSEIAIEVAKSEPIVFMDAIASLERNVPWRKEVNRLVAAGLKVDAVKLWRGETGTSLKEAHDAVSALAGDQI